MVFVVYTHQSKDRKNKRFTKRDNRIPNKNSKVYNIIMDAIKSTKFEIKSGSSG